VNFADYLRCVYGHSFGTIDLVVLFNARLDECGTDGVSPYTVISGAVSIASQWDRLETAWGNLLGRSKVNAYHWREWIACDEPFKGWSRLKRTRFESTQNKIIDTNTWFRFAIGVDRATHADIKRRMKGIKGFTPHSDYGLCLHYLIYQLSEMLVRGGQPDHTLSILVEDGPWASGASRVYQMIVASRWKYAHRLQGFATAPKGKYRSLEAADYLSGTALDSISAGRFKKRRQQDQLAILLDKKELEGWYQDMIKEKARRKAHYQSTKTTVSERSAARGQPS